jgi:hypothetical protein
LRFVILSARPPHNETKLVHQVRVNKFVAEICVVSP